MAEVTHYIVEVSVKEVRVTETREVYNQNSRKHERIPGDRNTVQVFHLTHSAKELEGSIVSCQKHLDVMLGAYEEADEDA